jgi:hypothetical protein
VGAFPGLVEISPCEENVAVHGTAGVFSGEAILITGGEVSIVRVIVYVEKLVPYCAGLV